VALARSLARSLALSLAVASGAAPSRGASTLARSPSSALVRSGRLDVSSSAEEARSRS